MGYVRHTHHSYAPRYIRYATRHIPSKPEIRTCYVPHYLPRCTSLRAWLLASLRTSLRTTGVVGSLQAGKQMLPSREEAQRGIGVQRCTEARRESRELLRASESVKERYSSARLHARWKGACLAANSKLPRMLPALEQRDFHFVLAAANHVTCSITRHVSDYVSRSPYGCVSCNLHVYGRS